jgi:hypothetical protein
MKRGSLAAQWPQGSRRIRKRRMTLTWMAALLVESRPLRSA